MLTYFSCLVYSYCTPIYFSTLNYKVNLFLPASYLFSDLIIDLNYRNGENKRLQNHQTNFNERPIMNEKIKHFEDDIKKIGAQISWIKNFFNLEDKKQDR